jgi:Tol biopolymer transport system component
VRSSDTGAERLLTPDVRFFIGPRWSPDGELVLVKGADGAGRWGLHAVDVGRGTAAPVLLGASLGQYLWSGDSGESGSVLYTVRGRIMRHRLADGSSSAGDTIFLDTRSEAITRMALSGDGRLAYSAIVQENGTRSVVLRVHDRNGDRELSRTTTPEALLCEGWSPDGRLVLFSRHREQTATSAATEPELLTVPGGGGDVRTTGLHLDGLRDVSLNPDGRQIAFTAGWPSRSLWAIEHLPSRAQDPGTGAHP